MRIHLVGEEDVPYRHPSIPIERKYRWQNVYQRFIRDRISDLMPESVPVRILPIESWIDSATVFYIRKNQEG